MTAQPHWDSLDNYTTDLLSLVAPATNPDTAVAEWECFLAALRVAARDGNGVIDQNTVRPLIAGAIKPQRVGPLYREACRQEFIRPEGWTVSDDRKGRNSGRPARSYRWVAQCVSCRIQACEIEGNTATPCVCGGAA